MATSVRKPAVENQQQDHAVPVKHLLPQVDELTFLIDPRGLVAEVSPSACSMLRVSEDQVCEREADGWFLEQDALRAMLAEAREVFAPGYSHLTILPEGTDSIPCVACAQRIEDTGDSCILLMLKPLEAWDREPLLAAEIQRLEERVADLERSLGETRDSLTEKTMLLAGERNKTLAVISNMTAGVVALDDEGTVTQANRMAELLLAPPRGGLTGRPLVELAPVLARMLADQDSFRFPVGEKTLQVDANPVFDAKGEMNGRVIVLHDRTREEEVQRMREELVSIVSHELRGPLTTVSGYLDVILRGEAGPVPSGIATLLGAMNENAGRLRTLIDDLLDLTRLEAGGLDMDRAPVNVTALLYCLYCDLQCRTDTKGICLQVEVPEEPIHVLGDEKRLLQVLTNLGSNAVKFTPVTGEVTLSAKQDGDRVTIKVADTGIGIPGDERERLFTKFFRSRETKRREIPGTGLGLCIAKRIVEAHEGKIQIESEEGKGTTARVTLPAMPEAG
jgi:two-component system sensor histidine kinase VicK